MDCYFILGTVATFLYILVVPESPRWLFLKDPQSAEGKKVLNYIAWFNGSKKKIANDAVMDNIGQLLQD